MLGPGRFRFLSVVRSLECPDDWNHEQWPRLWLYNLHYFDDLAADNAASRAAWHAALIRRWVAENPPGEGEGWQPYPTSLRIVNWVKWALTGNQLDSAALHSLAVQTRFLRRRLEVHLLGNHLWANAKALVFAGTYFRDAEADGWREAGLRLLRRELAAQVLQDGGHVERSPMYHAIVLADVLDLIQLSQRYPGLFESSDSNQWRDVATRMHRWLRVMTHPDGGIAFFNDAALGIAPSCGALEILARQLDLSLDSAPLQDVELLAESGYARLQNGFAVLIANVGSVGPGHLTGHAHADTLSCELSLDGRRVLVNGGTSTYEPGRERLQQRGTAAHNTVVVDGENSSEVWSSFRVARRARVNGVHCGKKVGLAWLEAAHDGYRRLPGRVIHRRSWHLQKNRLEIRDELRGQWKSAFSHWHLHPDLRVRGGDNGIVKLEGIPKSLVLKASGGNIALSADNWHPEFGVSTPCTSVQIPIIDAPIDVTICWQPEG